MSTAPELRPLGRDPSSLELPPLRERLRSSLLQVLNDGPRAPSGLRLASMPAAEDRLLGHLRASWTDPLQSFLRWHREVGDVVRLRAGGVTIHLFAHPRHIRAILAERAREVTKPVPGRRALARVLGHGLLVSEGSFWLRQRRIAQPAFHKRRLDAFAERMVAASADLAREWEARARREESFDLAKDMMRLTLRIVQETLLGATSLADADRIGEAVTVVLEDTNQLIARGFGLPDWLRLPRQRRFTRSLEVLDEVVRRLIRERRGKPPQDDLLSMLLEASDEETGERMSDQQLRDEVMTIFLAGHETTANALSWTFYLLGLHPEADRALANELGAVLGDRDPTASDAASLDYTRMVLQESMRLYPPAWLMARAPIEDLEIDGYYIPAGSRIFLMPWVTHRHPELWPDPEGFDPERFRDAKAIDRFAYFPFGGGPRICIGNAFAMMEASLVLATLAKRFHLELDPAHRVEPEPLITLRPKGGVRVRARPRASARAVSRS